MLSNGLKRVSELYPDSIAINDLSSDKTISYRELWLSVRKSAESLCKFLGDEKYLGLVADQDTPSIIIILAAAVCHKVIIPIDPRLETNIILKMLSSYTDKVVTDDKYIDKFNGTSVIAALSRNIVGASDRYKESINKIYDSPVYILHTSGTTGKPKAVLANQSSLLHVAKCLGKRYYIGLNSKVLQYAYLSFDSSQIEIWATLLSGATLVVAGKSLREDMYGRLRSMIKNKQINVATLPSSLVMNCKTSDFSNLETLILAGEQCPVILSNKLFNKIPHLINAYGPTEAIICATTYEIKQKHSDLIPIGKPLPGMKIMLVDPISEEISTTDDGEMYLSSDYLAAEYINDPELTKMKFQGPNKLSESRYYKSGDNGQLLDDGNYTFIGRSDNQVKINGQRVELESIEAEIQHVIKTPKVAVVYIDEKKVKGIYCVLTDKIQISNVDLRALLTNNLPSYAIPSAFFTINEIPIDGNGKIDRKLIKNYVLDILHKDKKQKSNNKSNDLSKMLAIWSSVLNGNKDINDDSIFFDLGGDSLSAMNLVARINHEYNIDVGLSNILVHPVTPLKVLSTVNSKLQENRNNEN